MLRNDLDFWVGVIGTAASGTLNTLIEVSQASHITQFGAAAGGTLVNALNVLLRYGIKAYAVRVATGADAAATAVNVVGTGATDGLGLLSTMESATAQYPVALFVPGIQADNVITALNTRAVEAGTIGIADWLGTEAALNTARGTATGYGLKSKNLAIAFRQQLTATATEFLSAHLAALIAYQSKYGSIGTAPIGRTLRDVVSTTPASGNAPVTSNGVITSRFLGNNQYDLAGYLNTLAPSVTGQEALLIRMPLEGVLTRVLRGRLASKVGMGVNRTSAHLIEMELTNILNNYVAAGSLKMGFAKFNESASTFPIDGSDATLVYDICVTLIAGFLQSSTMTFSVVL